MTSTAQTLTELPYDDQLNMSAWIGQRTLTFQFDVIDGTTGENLGQVTPLRTASLSHDTSRTIKRQLQISLGEADTASLNTLSDRIDVSMVLSDGTTYPLGRYVFTDASQTVFTSGDLATMTLNDEMFIVDQEIEEGINAAVNSQIVVTLIQSIMEQFTFDIDIEYSPIILSGDSWGIGTSRGTILESLAVSGDFFSPWFNNNHTFRMIRTFNPADQVPTFDFDRGFQVKRAQIVRSNNLLTAPNRIIVISNAGSGVAGASITSTVDIAASAPNSLKNRGFVIPKTFTLPITDTGQALLVAQGIAQRATIFEQVSLITAIDPRHDSYDVIQWQGDLWLEQAWSMQLTAGGNMTHLLRKGYAL